MPQRDLERLDPDQFVEDQVDPIERDQEELMGRVEGIGALCHLDDLRTERQGTDNVEE